MKDVKKILNYNPQTGIFTWKKPYGMKVKIGQIAGSKNKGYILIKYNKKRYSAHRLAWFYMYGKEPKGVIDHINGIRDDNRINNLRDVSQLINSRNTLKPHKNNKNGIIGVNWDKNKWVARIRTDKGRIQIGRFSNINDAKNAYLKAKKIYHYSII